MLATALCLRGHGCGDMYAHTPAADTRATSLAATRETRAAATRTRPRCHVMLMPHATCAACIHAHAVP